MSPSEPQPPGPLARHDSEPVFDEPWQAQVLALAANLVEQGVFTAGQWSDALGVALRDAQARGEPDNPQTYYQSALAALEQLLDADGRLSAARVANRVEDWRQAYLHTPHGQPVELSAAPAPGGLHDDG